MSEQYDYDAVIIGAGISGLVCGCYLAKAGLKTLIVEKNQKPGGYCTSFVSSGYHFDAYAHALSSLRENGMLAKVMKDLDLTERILIERPNPSEIISTPRQEVMIFHEFNKTVKSFQDNFPKEKEKINDFLKFVVFSSLLEMSQLKSKTFEQVLKSYFKDRELIAMLGIVIYLLVGVSSSEVSAVIACLLWREFIFDGGYYPQGGMQDFADTLLKRFIEFKGTVLFSEKVKRIMVVQNEARGVVVTDGSISAKYIVSACDARQTFSELIGEGKVGLAGMTKLESMIVSSSVFLVYLGLDEFIDGIEKLRSNLYVINDSDENALYQNVLHDKNEHFAITSSSMRSKTLSGRPSLCIATNGICRALEYWNLENKNTFADNLIRSVEKVIPGLSKHVVFRGIATPVTLYHWTFNSNGAAYGWASTPEQFGDPDISQKTKIRNLYLTGHWSNLSSGISSVANCGSLTADLVIREEKK